MKRPEGRILMPAKCPPDPPPHEFAWAGACLHLTAPLSWVVGKGAVQAKAAAMGFDPVSVWTDSPPAMFPDTSPDPGGDTYFIAGTYNGAPQTLDRPSQLTKAWALPPPPTGA